MSAKSDRKSIYFLSLEIENVRCLGEKQELRLVDTHGGPARWTLIVGDNGVGKTTLLQCLAWMRPAPFFGSGTERQVGDQPSLQDQDPPDVQKQIGIQPCLNDRDTPDMERLLRDRASPTALQAEMVEIPTLDSFHPPTPRIRTGIMLRATNNKLTHVRRTVNEPKKTADPFFISYAANRHMGKQNAEELSEADPDDLLQTDSTELVDAADVLSRLDYSALKGNVKSKACLDSMKCALVNILPFINEASDIDVRDPEKPGGRLRFRTPFGDVSLDGLSLGHRTVTAWIVDLAWRLVKRYPESTKPLEEPAVVLIDEIDLHVHPRWQRTIMQQISCHFTNVQFVATTHSPMMVGSMSDVNVVVLRQTEAGDQVVIENEPEVVEGWRVDQILVSLFGLETARSLRVETLMKKRELLLEKKSHSPQERARLRAIADELSSLPTAERTEDLEAMRIIREAAAALRARQEDRA